MKKFSLLYVDDEESNLRIFKDTFRRKYNVFTAISAKEGIKILDTNEIDLVLSDQRMPEMTGVEFLKYSLEKYPEPFRILITGYSDIDAMENAINHARIFQYIQKPWKEDELLKVIDTALKIYHLEKENEIQKEELILAKEKAEESDRLKTEFLSNMSHEIRTPMNGILGFSELLDDQELSCEKRKNYISVIQNSGNQLLRIIDDVLEISMLGTQQVKAVNKQICLNDLLFEIFSIFNIKAKEGITPLYLKRELSDKESIILTDEVKLNKILCNLLENALKFTSEGFIEFGYQLIDTELEIYVKDTGIGIEAEKQGLIFERFSQEEKGFSKKFGGLGLGLSIAKENAEILGGKITLKSEKGKGATFIVTIPYKPVYSDTGKDNSKKDKGETSEKQDKYTILVVEDEEVNTLFLDALLEDMNELNYKVVHAKNGQESVNICRDNEDIAIVLMDIKMPVMSGHEATKLIKEFRPNLPIIAQTAYSTKEDREKALLSGCDDFIIKPINAEVFSKAISRYLLIKE